ncbi:STAS domain-containing protein [Bacillus wiedmannii]|uniref:STAS domain-containing protein n=1 Tax=Bacillus wiedmannii TaxID=1890302 RepID=UPI000BF1278F|nr:STAS domain-containing protein [Bacillus wiedmannii]PEJ72078.1 anti-anti-sigma factor [Bacillus wiedmannii]
MHVEIHTDEKKVTYTFVLTGELDAHYAPVLKKQLDTILEQGHSHIVLDVSRVTYMDSTGLGVCMGLLKKVHKQDGFLEVTGVSSRIQRLFDLTGFTEILQKYGKER